MPENNSNEAIVAIFASIALFVCVAIALVAFVLFFQRKKGQQTQQILDIEKETKRQLVESKLEVEEQTRLYIARELHDNIGTLSSLIKINLGLIASSADGEKRQGFLTESQELIRVLISEVKQLSVSLNSDRLTAIPFSLALTEEIARVQRLELFHIDLSVTGDEYAIEPEKQLIIYRVCQELLHNIIKHAKASNVLIAVVFEPGRIDINITDDGAGFDTSGTGGPKGSGLINIHNRIKLIGGSLYLNSAPQKGTQCAIQIPAR